METSCADRICAFLIHCYVYSKSLGWPERAHLPQGIDTHSRTHPGVPVSTLSSPARPGWSLSGMTLKIHYYAARTCHWRPPGENGPRWFPCTAVSCWYSCNKTGLKSRCCNQCWNIDCLRNTAFNRPSVQQKTSPCVLMSPTGKCVRWGGMRD